MMNEFDELQAKEEPALIEQVRKERELDISEAMKAIVELVDPLRDRIEDLEYKGRDEFGVQLLTPSSDLEAVKKAVNGIILYLNNRQVRTY